MNYSDFHEEIEGYLLSSADEKTRAARMEVALRIRDALDRGALPRRWRKDLLDAAITHIRKEMGDFEVMRDPGFDEGRKESPVRIYRRSWPVGESGIPLISYGIACEQKDFLRAYYGIRKAGKEQPYEGSEAPAVLGEAVPQGFTVGEHWVAWRFFEEPWSGMWQDAFFVAVATAGKEGFPELAKEHFAEPVIKLIRETIASIETYLKEFGWRGEARC